MSQITGGGRKIIRTAALRLEEILEPSKDGHKIAPLIAPEADPNLPAIFAVRPFPLLLPHIFLTKQACGRDGYGVVVVTSDGRLLHWRDPRYGARQLIAALPRGRLRWLDIDENGQVRALLGSRTPTLITANLNDGACALIDLDLSLTQPAQVVLNGGMLLFLESNAVQVCDPRTGARRGAAAAPDKARHHSGRFYQQWNAEWFAAAWDGAQVRFEPFKVLQAPHHVLAAFERDGLDGPWIVASQGKIFAPVLGQEVALQESLGWLAKVTAISRDGHRLSAQGATVKRGSGASAWNHTPTFHIDLKTGAVKRDWWPGQHRFLEPELIQHVNQRTLRKKAHSILTTRAGELALLGARGRRVCIAWDEKERRIILRRFRPHEAGARTTVPFAAAPSPPGMRLQLRVARLGGGHRVYLDLRGLLHLKSAAPDVPETTLALCESGAVAGWCSDGAVCGDAFFLPEPQRSDPAAVFANVQKFVSELP